MSKSLLVAFSLIIVLLLVTVGCEYQSVQQRKISSNHISSAEEDFREITSRANSGDAIAAMRVARIYDGRIARIYDGGDKGLSVKSDRRTAFHYYKLAADLGHEEALRIVFNSYYWGGRYGPENGVEARNYLIKASNMGHEWAMLLLASRSGPEKAMDLYLQLARIDNCHAQRALAKKYLEGKLVPKDPCKSYFWALLASVDQYGRNSDCHSLAIEHFTLTDSSRSCSCAQLIPEKAGSFLLLSPEYVDLVQAAASMWQKGEKEPDLPQVQFEQEEEPSLVKIIPPDSLKISKKQSKDKPIEWIPADIELNTQLKVNLTSSEIFDLINPSVWTVVAASTIDNLKAMNNISQGSAVAISKNMLLTNYHVIDKKPYVLIKHGEQFAEAAIYAGDKQSDRCILITESIELKPVKGFTKYNQLSVGDIVYSVGSPQGLENTLAQGIISGKRELDKQKIIQTTAPMSRGSSGGGLFDCSGNLIGITTSKIIEGEGLNFAISIEEFTK